MAAFPEQLPHGTISEVFPDIFFVSGQVRPDFNGQSFQFSRNMVVLRHQGELTLVNSLRLNEAGLEQLDSLGKVSQVVKLGTFHGRDDAFYLDRYPEAVFWAPANMPHERGVTAARILEPGAEGPLPGASVFLFETSQMPEAILHLERDGGILLSCDSLHNWTGPDEFFDEPSAKMMQGGGFFHSANVGPGWLRAAKPQTSDFDRLKALEYRHLLSAHGEPLLDQASLAVEATLQRLFQI